MENQLSHINRLRNRLSLSQGSRWRTTGRALKYAPRALWRRATKKKRQPNGGSLNKTMLPKNLSNHQKFYILQELRRLSPSQRRAYVTNLNHNSIPKHNNLKVTYGNENPLPNWAHHKSFNQLIKLMIPNRPHNKDNLPKTNNRKLPNKLRNKWRRYKNALKPSKTRWYNTFNTYLTKKLIKQTQTIEKRRHEFRQLAAQIRRINSTQCSTNRNLTSHSFIDRTSKEAQHILCEVDSQYSQKAKNFIAKAFERADPALQKTISRISHTPLSGNTTNQSNVSYQTFEKIILESYEVLCDLLNLRNHHIITNVCFIRVVFISQLLELTNYVVHDEPYMIAFNHNQKGDMLESLKSWVKIIAGPNADVTGAMKSKKIQVQFFHEKPIQKQLFEDIAKQLQKIPKWRFFRKPNMSILSTLQNEFRKLDSSNQNSNQPHPSQTNPLRGMPSKRTSMKAAGSLALTMVAASVSSTGKATKTLLPYFLMALRTIVHSKMLTGMSMIVPVVWGLTNAFNSAMQSTIRVVQAMGEGAKLAEGPVKTFMLLNTLNTATPGILAGVGTLFSSYFPATSVSSMISSFF